MARVRKNAQTKSVAKEERSPGQPYTPAEAERHEFLVENYMVRHPEANHVRIKQHLSKTHKIEIDKDVVRNAMSNILIRWRSEDERSQRQDLRSIQIRSIRSDMAAARAEKNWSAVAKFQEMLMRITGTAQPEEVRVEIAVTNAMKDVILEMDEDELNEVLGEVTSSKKLPMKSAH